MTLRNFFKRIINNYQRNRQIKATVRELHALTNAELNDIGLSRGEIYDVAHKSFPNENLKGWV
jgi:uncharacterized protein YjiS (DUF1127 family)